MDSVLHTLKAHFGHSAFRPGQEALVRSILQERDTLGILPTGGGKSICYQVPALLFPGITIVVSPLLSLMADQVEKLAARGIPAACLTSTQSQGERREILRRCLAGYPKGAPAHGIDGRGATECASPPPKLLYLSPERLLSPEFREAAVRMDISFICIDEAHCVSQWGESFRPAYRQIPEFLALLPARPVLAAFTATATPAVLGDIIGFLGLRHPFVKTTTFDRQNLFYRICHVRDKEAALLAFLEKYRGQCGIVYCLTRRTAESVARRLVRAGIPAACYHGGLPKERRDSAQNAWLAGQVLVMAATCAFGMGIDKPNVRFVLHFQMPGSVENYYQEAGRAGRDGLPSDCVLLYGFKDVVVNRFFAYQDKGEVRANGLRRLLDMRRYAASKGCHRAWLLRYFGEEAPDFCGKCSFCLRMVTRERMTNAERVREDADLLRSLRALRLRLAKKNRTLPYRILPDEVLEDLAHLRPRHLPQLFLMEGAGFLSILRFGRSFLEEIRVFEETR